MEGFRFVVRQTCGGYERRKISYFTSPKTSAASDPCTYTVNAMNENVCQMRSVYKFYVTSLFLCIHFFLFNISQFSPWFKSKVSTAIGFLYSSHSVLFPLSLLQPSPSTVSWAFVWVYYLLSGYPVFSFRCYLLSSSSRVHTSATVVTIQNKNYHLKSQTIF